jgi:hypothetical protein
LTTAIVGPPIPSPLAARHDSAGERRGMLRKIVQQIGDVKEYFQEYFEYPASLGYHQFDPGIACLTMAPW